MDLQRRLEIQAAVLEWTESFMMNNGVSSAEMEDALTKTLVIIKEKVIKDMLLEAQQKVQYQAQETPIEAMEEQDA